jgi:hypothetical protein
MFHMHVRREKTIESKFHQWVAKKGKVFGSMTHLCVMIINCKGRDLGWVDHYGWLVFLGCHVICLSYASSYYEC